MFVVLMNLKIFAKYLTIGTCVFNIEQCIWYHICSELGGITHSGSWTTALLILYFGPPWPPVGSIWTFISEVVSLHPRQ